VSKGVGTPAFREFAERKTREAERALIQSLITVTDRSAGRNLLTVGNAWTQRNYDGDFYLCRMPGEIPAVSLVFVQSREGNTAADNPEDLGGGATDKHLIYEGLSRVAADAVLAGAATATGQDTFFSVWHPEIVALREAQGLPRHPAQIVLSREGRLDMDALLFNVPDIPVIVLAGTQCRERCAQAFARRPWITTVPVEPDDLRSPFILLRRDFEIHRISAVGGRSTASSLIDANLVQDLCLTTAERSGGQPHTPLYVGARPPRLDLIVAKRGGDPAAPIAFEHFEVGRG
jgi:riboflavin biosynthesis pyrimidine reductase